MEYELREDGIQSQRPVFFKAFFGCQNDTLKFCNDTLNSESLDTILPCIEVKRFEINMFSCTWRLQQTAGMLQTAEVGSGNCKFGICALSCAPLRFGLLLYCRRFVQYGVRSCKSTLNAIIEVLYCFTVGIGLPGDASDYNEDKRLAVVARMQNKMVVE